MALEDEIEALRSQGQQLRKRSLLARMRAIVERDRVLAYKRLFLDPDGELSADAMAVIADLGRVARVGIVDGPQMSDTELRTMAGRRAMVLHILARLDLSGEKMKRLATVIRENRE